MAAADNTVQLCSERQALGAEQCGGGDPWATGKELALGGVALTSRTRWVLEEPEHRAEMGGAGSLRSLWGRRACRPGAP